MVREALTKHDCCPNEQCEEPHPAAIERFRGKPMLSRKRVTDEEITRRWVDIRLRVMCTRCGHDITDLLGESEDSYEAIAWPTRPNMVLETIIAFSMMINLVLWLMLTDNSAGGAIMLAVTAVILVKISQDFVVIDDENMSGILKKLSLSRWSLRVVLLGIPIQALLIAIK